jgi:hypothetical protein
MVFIVSIFLCLAGVAYPGHNLLLLQDSYVTESEISCVLGRLSSAIRHESESELRQMLDRDLLACFDENYQFITNDMRGGRSPVEYKLLSVRIRVPIGGEQQSRWLIQCVVRILRANRSEDYAVMVVARRGKDLFIRTIPDASPLAAELWTYDMSEGPIEGDTSRLLTR